MCDNCMTDGTLCLCPAGQNTTHCACDNPYYDNCSFCGHASKVNKITGLTGASAAETAMPLTMARAPTRRAPLICR